MTSIYEIRRLAREHAQQLHAVRYLTTKDLAARFNVSEDLVKAIPRRWLPYVTLGVSRIRRYAPGDVTAYEEAEKRGEHEPAAEASA